MLKDYAKRSYCQPRFSKRRKWISFLSCVAAIVFAAFLAFDLMKYGYRGARHKEIPLLVKEIKPPTSSPPGVVASPSPSGIKFDFYTLLPKMQIVVPKAV